jgi:hypothetical protein
MRSPRGGENDDESGFNDPAIGGLVRRSPGSAAHPRNSLPDVYADHRIAGRSTTVEASGFE